MLVKGSIATGGVAVLGLGGAWFWQDYQSHHSSLYTFHQSVCGATWSPDGRHLATLTDTGGLIVWDTTSYKTIYSDYASGQVPVGAIQWSPDGHYIAASDSDHVLRIWRTSNWSSFTVSSTNQTMLFSLAWSPDSKYVAAGSANKLVSIYGIDGTANPVATLVFTYNLHQDGVTSLAWASNNKFIASGSLDGTLRVWHPLTGETLTVFSEPAIHPITAVTCSPDNQMLAYTFGPKEDNQQPMNPFVVQVVHALSGAVMSRYTGHTDYVEALAWSPNGAYIASGGDDTTVHIWQPQQAQNIYVYRGHTGRVRNIVWSPDSIYLSTTSDDNTLQVWKNPES